MEFLSALFAIIIIDLVLAGDNAIVIALAARNLPPDLRTKAVIWGTGGAVFVRTLMTLVVVWLLQIPGLLLVGGVLLIWIAYKLLIDSTGGEEHHIDSGGDFWSAMKTIVIADAVMGLDNVLAVAGAAHGNFLLVVLGLLISIPIMIAGSQIILKYVQRFPVIVYIGAGVLLWTAAKMVSHEPLISDWFVAMGHFIWLYYLIIVGAVLFVGHRRNSARQKPVAQVATPEERRPE